ncbi:hydroxyacid dehydrogenase [Starkeya sp. ORNL1]|uniref:hydroxyacid dehydrogenase n=1 Tax=Starkeya sp. ORNL1 TaxID=2709380 RepID=UPI001462D95B|nr:hydroxyacid dehydrogenase [Starkeya sp. ORNL1]QJP14974.1 hydroxyacid dehydrogenase [Starkeya sp. ORNL1]
MGSREAGGVCLVLQAIHAAGIERLRKAGCKVRFASSLDPAVLAREIADACAVLTRDARVDDALMAAAPRLAVIGVHGTGVDNIAVEAATARGIAVVNTPGANARSVAEHALALTFHLAKSIGIGDRAARQSDGTFKYSSRLVELDGATFGVIGFGAIGRATARLAKALGMEVIGWSRSQDDDAFAAEGVRRVPSLDDVLSESDVVSLHVPSNPATRGMIGRDQLARMKPNAYLINTARGALIDEAALAEALVAGRIAGAGLDVFAVEPLPASSPLIGLDNVVLTPHVGGSTEAALYRAATTLADEVLAVLEGAKPDHLVNEAVWPRIASGERAL